MTRRTCVTLTLAGLAACSSERTEQQGSVFSDSSGVSIAYTSVGAAAPPCEVQDGGIRIGEASGDSAQELYGVRDGARLKDGRVAILNSGSWQVKVFDATGSLTNEFGTRGQGPGEFKNLWSIEFAGADTLVIGEYRPWRFSYFTADGRFLRSIEMRPAIIERPEVGIALSSGNGFLMGERCCSPENGFVAQSVIIAKYDREGLLADTVGSFWFTEAGVLSPQLRYVGAPIFGARATFASFRGDTIVYASGQLEQVELWTTAGGPSRIVRWSSRDRTVRRADVEEWKRQYQERFRGDRSSPNAQEMLRAETGDHRPVANTFPALDEWNGLVVSREGEMWVKEYRRPLDRGPDQWLVFHPTGALACRAATPAGSLLLDAGSDYIITRETDALDVEYITIRTVQFPSSTQE